MFTRSAITGAFIAALIASILIVRGYAFGEDASTLTPSQFCARVLQCDEKASGNPQFAQECHSFIDRAQLYFPIQYESLKYCMTTSTCARMDFGQCAESFWYILSTDKTSTIRSTNPFEFNELKDWRYPGRPLGMRLQNSILSACKKLSDCARSRANKSVAPFTTERCVDNFKFTGRTSPIILERSLQCVLDSPCSAQSYAGCKKKAKLAFEKRLEATNSFETIREISELCDRVAECDATINHTLLTAVSCQDTIGMMHTESALTYDFLRQCVEDTDCAKLSFTRCTQSVVLQASSVQVRQK
jgi:hypothetical protein